MNKFLTNFFYVFKYLLFLLSLVLIVYIYVFMNHRLGNNITKGISLFLPFAILFFLYFFNLILKSKQILENIFYNITSCLVFGCIVFICYRSIFDTNMLFNYKLGYNINFNYFNDFILPIKIMLYGLIFSNVILSINIKSKSSLTKKV